MPRSSSSLSNAVGCHDPSRAFLRPRRPTKHEPLSDSIAAGAPNRFAASRSTATAFSEVASLNMPAPVTHRDESSRHATKFEPLKRESFISCQPACHVALEYLLSKRTHFLRFALPGDGTTIPPSFMILQTLP